MKVFKRYLRGFIFAAVVFVMFFWGTGNTVAADLEQSPDEVSMEIVHEHDEGSCYTKVWIPCGGTWVADRRGHLMIYYCTKQKSEEIVNGHSLSEIHFGDWYWGAAEEEVHEGGYVDELDCNLSTIGNFAIKRTEDEDGIHLTAYTTAMDDDFGDYTITWDDGTEGAVNSSVTIDVDTRRTYTAMLTWRDVKRDKDLTASLSYTDVSYPCSCEFVSDGEVIEEKKIRSGEKPEKMDVPEKTGYIFDGYYMDDNRWIDQEGNATSDFNISQSDYDITLTAKWTAKTYELKIGKEVLTFVYDEPYDDIDIEALGLKKNGYGFNGVVVDGEMIFNADGEAVGDGIWKWDIPEDSEAEISWEKLPDPTPTPTPTSKPTATPTSMPVATPTPTPTTVPTVTPTPTPTAGTTNAEDDNNDGDGKHHHHHDNDDTDTASNGENEDSVSDAETVNTVSEDRSEVTVSSDEAVINEVLQEDNDDENDQGMETDSPVGENDVLEKSEETEKSEDYAIMELEEQELSNVELSYTEVDELPAEKNTEPDESDQKSDKGQGMTENASLSVWIKKAMIVVAVACGVVGGGAAAVYAVHAGFVYLFGMALVINVLPDGKKKNLGKLTVADRAGGDIEINIPQRFIDCCSTGNVEIVLPPMFVKKRDRKQLVIIVNEKKYLKNIKKNVELKLFA